MISSLRTSLSISVIVSKGNWIAVVLPSLNMYNISPSSWNRLGKSNNSSNNTTQKMKFSSNLPLKAEILSSPPLFLKIW